VLQIYASSSEYYFIPFMTMRLGGRRMSFTTTTMTTTTYMMKPAASVSLLAVSKSRDDFEKNTDERDQGKVSPML